MDNEFSKVENKLFQVIRQSLLQAGNDAQTPALDEAEWAKFITIAEHHAVLPLLYSELCSMEEVPENIKKRIEKVARRTALQQYHLLFSCKYVIHLLEELQISSVLLKGVTAGTLYPVPEFRKSGDVDLLLLNPKTLPAATELLKNNGFQLQEEQHSLHHVCFISPEGIEVEVHTMLAEPFDNEKTNECLQEILQEAGEERALCNVMGMELPVLTDAYYALELLLHMLQHFLRSGFGLKLLCDWVMFWQKKTVKEARNKYLELVERLGVKGFSDVITQVCVQYLGLEESLVSWMNPSADCPTEEFLRDILEAEEFGTSSKERMVVMRGTGVLDYVREFHHQMRLNYPRAGRCFLLWPLLWLITLIRFVRNNYKLRKVSTAKILKEATRRSRMMKKMKLFQ